MSRALFFLNSNNQTGLGHFSRCLNIARHLKENKPKLEIVFQGDLNVFSQNSLKKYGFNFKLSTNPFEEKPEVQSKNINIFDSYLIDQGFIDQVCIEENNNFFVDDFGVHDFSKAKGVINFTIAPKYSDSNSAKNMLLGPKYFPYKPEIRTIREKQKREEIRNVLVFISNSSVEKALVTKALELISHSAEGLNLLLITNDKENEVVGSKLGFEVKQPISEVEEFYNWADLIISGGGLVKYESSYCLIPIVSFSLNQGQEDDSILLSNEGLINYLGPIEELKNLDSVNRMKEKLTSFIQNKDQRLSQLQKQKTIFDSDSGKNLAMELIGD